MLIGSNPESLKGGIFLFFINTHLEKMAQVSVVVIELCPKPVKLVFDATLLGDPKF